MKVTLDLNFEWVTCCNEIVENYIDNVFVEDFYIPERINI